MPPATKAINVVPIMRHIDCRSWVKRSSGTASALMAANFSLVLLLLLASGVRAAVITNRKTVAK